MRCGAAVEVETEIEDEGEEGEEQASPSHGSGAGTAGACGAAAEVEEDLVDDDDDRDPTAAEEASMGSSSQAARGSRPGSGRGGGGGGGGDYAVPSANREVWKQFGCNTEAGRALRRLYKGGAQSDASSMVSYPRLQSPSQKWEAKPAARKPCPQRAPVRVPKASRPKYDPDDPRNWRVPLPGRKPANQIMAEMEADQPEMPNLPQGRNNGAEKQQLQDRFQFCGGRAMPKGAMGHVEHSEDLPQVVESIRGRLEERRRRDENGMDAEQRDIFEELMLAIKHKQERISEIDAEDATDPKPGKARTARNKEALELRNEINRNLADIDKLMELADP